MTIGWGLLTLLFHGLGMSPTAASIVAGWWCLMRAWEYHSLERKGARREEEDPEP